MRHIHLVIYLLIAMFVCTCEVNETEGTKLTVTYALPTDTMPAATHQMRYAVVWMGSNVWEVTADSPVPPGATTLSIPIKLPAQQVLEQVQPAETLTYAYYYLPETPIRRPRIVVYDDLNQNKQFDIVKDTVLALDSFQLDYYGTVLAFVDLDDFLSTLDIEGTEIYYGWSFDQYSRLIFGVADPDWSNYVMPLFEDAHLNNVTVFHPTLELQTGNEMLMEKDMLCFRQVEETHESTYEQLWVDDTLNVEEICATTTIPCAGFDATVAPDFSAMAESADVYMESCGWNNSTYQPMAVSVATVSCNGCQCFYNHHVYTYYLNISAQPEWSVCIETGNITTD